MNNANNIDAETAAALDDLYGGPRKSAAEILDIVRAGGIAYVPSNSRVLMINAKTLAKFEAVGQWLIKDEGTGYRIKEGKRSVFVFRGGLKTKEGK